MIEHAQKKLSMLQQAAADAMALAQAAKRQTGEIERTLALKSGRASETEIQRTLDEHERALNLQQQRYRAWQDAEGLMTRLNGWVRGLPRSVVLEPVPTPIIAMNGNPSIVVGTLRAAISKLASEHHAIRVAGPTPDDARAQIRTLVETLGKRGKPRVVSQLGAVRVDGWMGDEISHGVPVPHVISLQTICWLAPQMVTDALERELGAVPADAHALPYDQRHERLAQLEQQIAELEYEEEFLIERAQRDGVTIERRFDQSPASILDVRPAAASAKVAA
jgi:hypothetical protein